MKKFLNCTTLSSIRRYHKLILFPAMGSNEKIFHPQLEQFGSKIQVVQWTDISPPTDSETLPQFSKRMARYLLDSGIVHSSEPFHIGGMSMGGMIALLCSRWLQKEENVDICLKKLLLIASCVSVQDCVPNIFKITHRFLQKFPGLTTKILAWYQKNIRIDPDSRRVDFKAFSNAVYQFFEGKNHFTPEEKNLIEQMILSHPPDFIAWSMNAVLKYNVNELMNIAPDKQMPDLYHIHGDMDAIIPYSNVEKYQPFYSGEYVLEKVVDGGHFITLTHPKQVNAFIEKYFFSEE